PVERWIYAARFWPFILFASARPLLPTIGLKPMSLTLDHDRGAPVAPANGSHAPRAQAQKTAAPAFHVIRRNGSLSDFDAAKISVALTKAFLAVEGNSAAASRRVHEIVSDLTDQIVAALTRRAGADRVLHIEDVQDQVELALMRG